MTDNSLQTRFLDPVMSCWSWLLSRRQHGRWFDSNLRLGFRFSHFLFRNLRTVFTFFQRRGRSLHDRIFPGNHLVQVESRGSSSEPLIHIRDQEQTCSHELNSQEPKENELCGPLHSTCVTRRGSKKKQLTIAQAKHPLNRRGSRPQKDSPHASS